MRKISQFIFFFVFLFSSSALMGWDDSPSCFKELQLSFFKEKYVSEAMSLHSIYQSQWRVVVYQLSAISREIPQITKLRASRMYRNPIDYPFQPGPAAELLSTIFYEIFHKIMNDHNIVNEADIADMFNFIVRSNANLIKACFGDLKAFIK